MSANPTLPQTLKTCTTCREAKPLTEFCRKASTSDGLNSQCKACTAKARRDYYERNRERQNATSREWKRKNADRVKAYQQEWYAENREKQIADVSKWARENKEWRSERRRLKYATDEEHRQRVLEGCQRSYIRNIEKIKQRAAEYYLRTSDVKKQQAREWRNANPGKVGTYRAIYRTTVARAVPAWYDHEEVDKIYRLAREMTEREGIKYEVDHIVPLQSKLVCGLHWHGNLQIIPLAENRSKHNGRWPDMP